MFFLRKLKFWDKMEIQYFTIHVPCSGLIIYLMWNNMKNQNGVKKEWIHERCSWHLNHILHLWDKYLVVKSGSASWILFKMGQGFFKMVFKHSYEHKAWYIDCVLQMDWAVFFAGCGCRMKSVVEYTRCVCDWLCSVFSVADQILISFNLTVIEDLSDISQD